MTKIKNIILGLAITTVLLTSCNGNSNSSTNQDNENTTDVFTKIYSVENLNSQSFTIDNSIDNLITGESGTIVRINRNTFIDQEGKTITGKIEIKLIEALTPIDMVLGNLTTTFNGKPLETGGMIYLNAIAENKEVSIAPDKSILIKMPSDSTLTGMSVFEGKQDSTGIKWENPIKLPVGDTIGSISSETFEKTTNVFYRVDGFQNQKDETPNVERLEMVIPPLMLQISAYRSNADTLFG